MTSAIKTTPEPMKILGYTMRELTNDEREGFAGASAQARCCDIPDGLLIFDPASGSLEHYDNETGIATMMFQFVDTENMLD
jgi:hypothetical protein